MNRAEAAAPAGPPSAGGRSSARVRILHGMMALNDHRSVQEHTVDELARIAGVAKGSVYYHFGSKDKLVREMLVHGAAELQDIMDLVRAEHPRGQVGEGVSSQEGVPAAPSDAPDRDHSAFRAQLYAAFEFLGDYPSFTGLVAFALAQRQGDDSSELRTEKEAIVRLLADQLAQLEQSGAAGGGDGPRTGPRASLKIAATALLSAAVTLSIERLTVHPEWSADDCVDALLRMVTSASA